MKTPACISGAAAWVLNFSASDDPVARRDRREAAREQHREQRGRRRRGSRRPSESPTIISSVIGISTRRLADSTVPASSTPRGAGDASRRSNQPSSMSRARLTPVAAPGEAGALQEADRQDEGQVVVGREAGQQRQVAEHGRQAEHEDRRREHGRDHRAGTRSDLVDRRAASAPRSMRRSNATPVGHADLSLSLSAPRAERGADRRNDRDPAERLRAIGPSDSSEMIGSRSPSAIRLIGFQSRDRLRRLEQQVLAGRRPTTGTGSRTRAGRCPARRSRCRS